MTTPGYFELYPAARPALPAGSYTAASHQDLQAAPPHGADGTIHVDDTKFHLHVVSPRYTMPPDQILSTFPPAGSRGDWRERLPQIVLKRRTLPWERNPDPAANPATAPPWLALVVLADGEGLQSPEVDVSACVTSGVNLGSDADVPTGKYLDVTDDVVKKVFPCRDELGLLCHVRKVDLTDTELALGDDDGYLAVVLSNRLPQPAPPAAPGGEPQPLRYTAYLINLEHQLANLLATEPCPVPYFDATLTNALVDPAYLQLAPDATVDQIAMQLGAGAGGGAGLPPPPAWPAGQVVPFGTGTGLEAGAAGWSIGPVAQTGMQSTDLIVATGYKSGVGQGRLPNVAHYRFPVLVSWDFTCTASGGFERLMNDLDVGLLGTLPEAVPPPVPQVAATGHVTVDHRTRRGEPARSWYRGPLSPQPTLRTMPVAGVLPLAHTSDQLRKVVPDGREDISLAAMFEIGRLLTLSKPTLIAALMDWRRELFGAARARELANTLTGMLVAGFGIGVVGGRASLEDLIRTQVVGAFTVLPPDGLAPRAQEVTRSRVPAELAKLDPGAVLTGLGTDPVVALQSAEQYGAEAFAGLAVAVDPAATIPVSQDPVALGALQDQLARRVAQLTVDALKLNPYAAHAGAPDTLDRLIARAGAVAGEAGAGEAGAGGAGEG